LLLKEGDKVNYIGVNLLLKAKEFESSVYFLPENKCRLVKN